jgi:hypothetical protein
MHVHVQMGSLPQEQVALPTTLQFVLVATQAGLSTVLLARQMCVAAQMGMQPQEQLVLFTRVINVQVATWAGLSMVLLARQTLVHA